MKQVTTISLAELHNLRSAPKIIIAAPGAGKAIMMQGILLEVIGSSGDWAGGAAGYLNFATPTLGTNSSDGIDQLSTIMNTAGSELWFANYEYRSVSRANGENQPIVLFLGTGSGAPTGTAGTMRVTAYYQAVDLA